MRSLAQRECLGVLVKLGKKGRLCGSCSGSESALGLEKSWWAKPHTASSLALLPWPLWLWTVSLPTRTSGCWDSIFVVCIWDGKTLRVRGARELSLKFYK